MTSWTRCWRTWTRSASRSRTPSGAGARGRGGAWVAYLYDARDDATYAVRDHRAYQEDSARLPDAWRAREPRLRRNGRDYSDADEAQARFTLAEVRAAFAYDRATGLRRVRALHVRYGDGGDDRYLLVADGADGAVGRREIASPDAYHLLYRTSGA